MEMPMVWSLSEATNSSTSLGTWWTLCSSLPLCLTDHSVARAWAAKLMSMTLAGWPWAAARLISRPSPRT